MTNAGPLPRKNPHVGVVFSEMFVIVLEYLRNLEAGLASFSGQVSKRKTLSSSISEHVERVRVDHGAGSHASVHTGSRLPHQSPQWRERRRHHH